MDQIDRLAELIAKLYKENRNPPSTAPRTAKVVSIEPLKVQYGDSVILEGRHLIVARHVSIEISDMVIIVPSSDLKTWYVMGKA
jgi:hypothetical protein